MSTPLETTRNDLLKETVITIQGALNKSFLLGLTEGTNPNSGILCGFKLGESSEIVSEVSKFINPRHMNGLDIGSGGNPIFPQAISIDNGSGLLGPLIQIHNDARNLSMFNDSSLDYVFSSHCWEDFTENEKPIVLTEWIRVIKKGGFLMLYLPDESRYRASCAIENIQPNIHHKDVNFNLDKTRSIIQSDDYLRVTLKEIYSIPSSGAYSFFIVFTKN